MRVIAAVFVLSLLVGCAAQPSKPASSTKPEAYIPGANIEEIREIILERMMAKGWSIDTDSAHHLSFIRYTRDDENLSFGDKMMLGLFFGSKYDSFPALRADYSLIRSKSGVRIYLQAHMLTNPGSAFERRNDVTKPFQAKLQASLEEVRQTWTSRYGSGTTTSKPTAAQSLDTVGTYSTHVNHMVKDAGCEPLKFPSLIDHSSNHELYRVACQDGSTLTVECKYSVCNILQ